MSTRRGPSRFLNGVPAAYRQLELEGGPIPPQVTKLVEAAEYDMEDYKSDAPMLIIYPANDSSVPHADLRIGLNLFEISHGRSTWLEVSYFTGKELLPVEPLPVRSHGDG